MGRTKGAKDKKPRNITEEHREKLRKNIIKSREAIDNKNPATIANRQAGMAKARAANANPKITAANARAARKGTHAEIMENARAARKPKSSIVDTEKVHIYNPNDIKQNYNELFDECIQIPETPRDEDDGIK
jgi:hypothetical protein